LVCATNSSVAHEKAGLNPISKSKASHQATELKSFYNFLSNFFRDHEEITR